MASNKIIGLIEKNLSNSASETESETLNAWLNESEENQLFYKQAEAVWNRIDQPGDPLIGNESRIKENISLKIRQKQKQAKIRRIRIQIAAAASILLMFSIGYLFYNSNASDNILLAYTSGPNEVLELMLPDSSKVWLNKNSHLELAKYFSRHNRKVNLQGEAYFEVARDEQKAFKITAGKTITKVLGTSFRLKNTDNQTIQLIVNSGRVNFYKKFRPGKKEIYTANDEVEYILAENRFAQGKNSNPNYLSWKTGVLHFSDTPLGEVCTTLSNHFGIPVETSLNDSNLTINGSFKNEKLEDIFETISITLDINIVRTDSGKITLNK